MPLFWEYSGCGFIEICQMFGDTAMEMGLVDNSFDRYFCFIIGYFGMNGSGKLRIPYLSVNLFKTDYIQKLYNFLFCYGIQMDKKHIISEIQRLSRENGGKPPGVRRFESQTDIKMSEWYPKLWLRWNDALNEAGFKNNKLDVAYEEDGLILFYIELIRELGSFPIDGQLKRKAKESPNFPSDSSFKRLGRKAERARKIISFCKNRKDFEDVIEYCEPVAALEKASTENSFIDNQRIGYVYLIRHGNRKEYKIGKTYNQIRREGEIRLELPEKVEPIHTIATDDPSGVELYWHNRFSKKRKQGEWFELTEADVRAFKKWKRIH